MGITKGNMEWTTLINGEPGESFEVTECEQTIELTNELPCLPTPPPELLEVKELPVTGTPLGMNPAVTGMAGAIFALTTILAGFLRRR